MSSSQSAPIENGNRYSVKALRRQVHYDIIVCITIFIATQIGTASVCVFWRPIGYSIGWAVLAFLIGIIGLVGVAKKSSAMIIIFSVLLIMLACLNISHVLTMRSEHVHSCSLNQNTFRNCKNEASLSHCLDSNSCTREEILKTSCMAPGRQHCDALDDMNWMFIANMFISFITFAEPTFWAILLLIRMEMTFPITPDEDDADSACWPSSSSAEADENLPLIEGKDDKAGGATGGSGNGSGSGTLHGQPSLRWI